MRAATKFWLSSDLTFYARQRGLISPQAEINRTGTGPNSYKPGYYLRDEGRELFLHWKASQVLPQLEILKEMHDITRQMASIRQ